jgi:hypothetical protein
MDWQLHFGANGLRRIKITCHEVPKVEKRPANVIGNAVHVMRIATGEIQESTPASAGKDYARRAQVVRRRARRVWGSSQEQGRPWGVWRQAAGGQR